MNLVEFKSHFEIPPKGGIPSFCTANEFVLKAILEYGTENSVPVLIEATCNQVNQEGGYTGMKAQDFVSWVKNLARESGFPEHQLILGGDHLGPNPWRKEPANLAMQKAEQLVRDYVEAGFTKIHIDTSMACGDEGPLSFEQVATRAARLCKTAETFAPEPERLIYVIGTEVPTPGGELDDIDELSVTTPDKFKLTLTSHANAFEKQGISQALKRVVAIVTQPGVDFSHTSVHRFNPPQAKELVNAILKEENLVFEAHSTDYQPTKALKELVENQFFFLKVGPELTFRMREAVFALAQIESVYQPETSSNLIAVIDQAMDENPDNWCSYYTGEHNLVRHLRHYSYSDRIRYYWSEPSIKLAVQQLLENLDGINPFDTIISQYFPYRSFENLRAGAQQLIHDHVKLCVARYYDACGFKQRG